MKYVKEAGLISRFKELDILDRQKLDYDLHLVDNYMKSKGYLQARHGEPRIEGLGKTTHRVSRFCRCRLFLQSTTR